MEKCGTEFRSFLQYVGVVVLKNCLRNEEYMHFIKLHCAVVLCSTDKFVNKNRNKIIQLARDLFREYIEEYIELYGIEFISSNVHNLDHVVDDVLRFGNLTKISSYVFENCLSRLKFRLRNCDKPLEQISRRIIELDLDYRDQIDLDEQCKEPILKYAFESDGKQVHSQIIFGTDLLLNSRHFGDKWFLTDDGQVIEFNFALKRNGEYLLYGSCVKNLTNYFTEPFSSTKIYTFAVNIEKSFEKSPPQYFKLENVMAKMICLRNSGQLVFMPLLHTLK